MPIPKYFTHERAKALKEREKLLGQILAKLGGSAKEEVRLSSIEIIIIVIVHFLMFSHSFFMQVWVGPFHNRIKKRKITFSATSNMSYLDWSPPGSYPSHGNLVLCSSGRDNLYHGMICCTTRPPGIECIQRDIRID